MQNQDCHVTTTDQVTEDMVEEDMVEEDMVEAMLEAMVDIVQVEDSNSETSKLITLFTCYVSL